MNKNHGRKNRKLTFFTFTIIRMNESKNQCKANGDEQEIFHDMINIFSK